MKASIEAPPAVQEPSPAYLAQGLSPRALLDVNVLIALLDADHIHHQRASQWLARNLAAGWASCARSFAQLNAKPVFRIPPG